MSGEHRFVDSGGTHPENVDGLDAKLKKERGYEYVGETKHKCNVRSDF